MQKIFYLFIVFIFASLVSSAQIGKGSILLGGDISFNSQKGNTTPGNTNTYSSSNFTFAPSIGKAIKDNLVLGGMLIYGHQQNSSDQGAGNTSKATADTYGLGAFLRKYFPLGKGFSFFTEAQLEGFLTENKSDGTLTSKGEDLTFAFSPGIAYGISRRVQLELGLPEFFSATYTHNKALNAGADYSVVSTFSMGTDLAASFQNLDIGIKFLLGH
jgi:hypothetical protein